MRYSTADLNTDLLRGSLADLYYDLRYNGNMALGGNRSVGLDIADTSIEVAVVGEKKKGYGVVNTARMNLDPGVVENGRIKDETKLKEAIKQIFNKLRIKQTKMVFGLPETQVFTHVFKLENHEKKDRERLVFEEAQNYVPIKEEDLLFSYSILAERSNEIEVLLVAVSKQVFEEWQEFFKKLDLEVMFDVGSLALFRALFLDRPKEPVGIVDLGTYESNLSIFGPEGLMFGLSGKVGGHVLTNQVAGELQMLYLDAEQLKMTQGMTDLNHPVAKVLMNKLEGWVKEMQESLKYFHEQTGQAVINLSLVGGGSKLPGLVDWLKPQFEIEVKLGVSPLLKDKQDLEYIVATGLALRGFNRPQDQKDPVLQVKTKVASKLGKSVGEVMKKQEEPEVKILDQDSKDSEKKVVLVTPEELDELSKLKKQKKVLMAVVALGVLIITGAAWFRYDQRTRNQTLLKAEETKKAGESGSLIKKVDEVKEIKTVDGTEVAVEESLPATEALGRVVIQETPTGWLSVRNGPATTYERIGQVSPEEEYDYFEESGKWLRINLDGTDGWVRADYVSVTEEHRN